MHTAQRKVLVTARSGGSFTKGTGFNNPGGTNKAKKGTDWHGDWKKIVPSQDTLDRLADRQMAGLTASSPAKGARHAAICPQCHLQHPGEC